MIKEENSFKKKKKILDLHASKRFKERYPHLNLDEIADSLIECVKAQSNVISAQSEGKFRTKYLILYQEYFHFVYAKDVDTIVTFLPINFKEKELIKNFKKKRVKNIDGDKKILLDENDVKINLGMGISRKRKEKLRRKARENNFTNITGIEKEYIFQYLSQRGEWKNDESN